MPKTRRKYLREQIVVPTAPGTRVRLQIDAEALGLTMSAYVRGLISQALVANGKPPLGGMNAQGHRKDLVRAGETVSLV